jgi:hypothetical protein
MTARGWSGRARQTSRQRAQKGDRAGGSDIIEDLGRGQAGLVVDEDVHVRPARDARQSSLQACPFLAGAASEHAVAGAADAPQLLDIHVHEVARVTALVAIRGLRGSSLERFPSPMRRNHKDTVESGIASTSEISAAVMRSRRSASIISTRRGDKRAGLRRGRQQRSSSSRSPARYRATHFEAVPTLQPAASAAHCSVHASSSTRRHNRRRLLGQVRWLAWSFIRCPPLELVASTPPASREARMNNVIRNYI